MYVRLESLVESSEIRFHVGMSCSEEFEAAAARKGSQGTLRLASKRDFSIALEAEEETCCRYQSQQGLHDQRPTQVDHRKLERVEIGEFK